MSKTITITVPDNFTPIPVSLEGYVSSRTGDNVPTAKLIGDCTIFGGEVRTDKNGKPYYTGEGSAQLPLSAFNIVCELIEAGVFERRNALVMPELSDTAKKYLGTISFRPAKPAVATDATQTAGGAE